MRILAVLSSLPIICLLAWWGLSGSAAASTSHAISIHRVARETFKVTLQEKGELKAANSIDIKSEVEGRSTIISLVPEGTHVKKGDLLVELASDEIEERVQSQRIDVTNSIASQESAEQQFEILLSQNQSNIDKAKLKLELAELEYKKYEEGVWPQQLQDAELRVEEALKVWKREQEDLENAVSLYEKEYITKTEYEQDEFNAYKAGIEHQKAIRDLEILKQFTRVKDKQQKLSDVEEARKELDRATQEAAAKESESRAKLEARKDELELKQQRLKKLEEQMAKTKIYATAEGLVVYGDGSSRRFYGGDDQIKEGSTVYERQTILQLPNTSKMKVVLRIHEAQTDKIHLGQRAVIDVEGVAGKHYTGEITKIAVLADSQNRWLNPELKEYETEITLDQEDPLLKPGVTARAEIIVAELEDVLAVPVQSVYTKGPKSFVFVGHSPTDAEHVEVQLGLSSTDKVEIKSGLNPGQEVLLAVSEELKRQLPDIQIPTEILPPTAQQQPQSGAEARARPQGNRDSRGGKRPAGGGDGQRRPRRGGGARPG